MMVKMLILEIIAHILGNYFFFRQMLVQKRKMKMVLKVSFY